MARRLGISRRTAYTWIEQGLMPVASRAPLRIKVRDLAVGRGLLLTRPGRLYRRVAGIRLCSYDTARVWVRRRQRRGLHESQILGEAYDERKTRWSAY